MTKLTTEWIEENTVNVAPAETNLKVGDYVTFTDINGVIHHNVKVIGFEPRPDTDAVVYLDKIAFWIPVPISSLSLQSGFMSVMEIYPESKQAQIKKHFKYADEDVAEVKDILKANGVDFYDEEAAIEVFNRADMPTALIAVYEWLIITDETPRKPVYSTFRSNIQGKYILTKCDGYAPMKQFVSDLLSKDGLVGFFDHTDASVKDCLGKAYRKFIQQNNIQELTKPVVCS